MNSQKKQFQARHKSPPIDYNAEVKQNEAIHLDRVNSIKNKIVHEFNYENNKQNNDEKKQQLNHFITEVPLEVSKQIDNLRERHRKRLQEQREQYKQSQMANESEEQEQNNSKNDGIKYMSPETARKESIAIIEQGKDRRQRMISSNLNLLQNKLHQDAQKIEETINLLRIEIVETQRDIKQKAMIEREQVKDYHTSMHKQISELLKMKHNIQLNQQQIRISSNKKTNQRSKRSVSESQFKSKEINKYGFKQVQHRLHSQDQNSNFNSIQRHEFQNDNNYQDEDDQNDHSLFYDGERQHHQEYSNDYQTFNPKPLFLKMEDKYRSDIVLPEIQQRENILKKRTEEYRKRMEPLKYFKDHERKYGVVKEIKERERNEKQQKQIDEMKQHSLEKFTKSQTYVKTLNEEHKKKEDQQKKEILQKILLEKQKNYQPSKNDSFRMKRSQSSYEVSHSFVSNKKISIKQSHQSRQESQISKEDKSNKEYITNKEGKTIQQDERTKEDKRSKQGVENHKSYLMQKDILYFTKDTSIEHSSSEKNMQNSDQKQHQKLKKQKRRILTQKFYGDNSPLPEVFISDELYPSERKKSSLGDISQDLIEVRKLQQFSFDSYQTDNLYLEQGQPHLKSKYTLPSINIFDNQSKIPSNSNQHTILSAHQNQQNKEQDAINKDKDIKNKNKEAIQVDVINKEQVAKNNEKDLINNKIQNEKQSQQSNSQSVPTFTQNKSVNTAINEQNQNHKKDNNIIKLNSQNDSQVQILKNETKIQQQQKESKEQNENKMQIKPQSQQNSLNKQKDMLIVGQISHDRSENADLNRESQQKLNANNKELQNNKIEQKQQKINNILNNDKKQVQSNPRGKQTPFEKLVNHLDAKSQERNIKTPQRQMTTNKSTQNNSILKPEVETGNFNIQNDQNEQMNKNRIIEQDKRLQNLDQQNDKSDSPLKQIQNYYSPIKQKQQQQQQLPQKIKQLSKDNSAQSQSKRNNNTTIESSASNKHHYKSQQQLPSIKKNASPEKEYLQAEQLIEDKLDQKMMNGDIEQLYKKFKQIKGKSKRSVSEIPPSRNDNSQIALHMNSQDQSRTINEYNKIKYKDYMQDIKQKYKLSRQIDDWRKIDQNEMLNNQEKIIKLSEKVMYLDNKLEQMKSATKQNRGQFQRESEKIDEDALLINTVQAKMAILSKLN